ncbi:MAG TPA: alginate export family protein [Phycisphaerae bacterium]|nr:alginate export family protein [Phycisphaerae bacterium]
MRLLTGLFLAGTVLGFMALPASAQPRPEEVFQRSLFLEKAIRDRLEGAVPTDQKTLIEWGGAYIPTYTFYDDVDGGHAHLTRQDLRLWTQVYVDQVHRVFARMRMNYVDFAAGDAQGFRQHDLGGPSLDVGYYELDVSAAAEKYGGRKWPVRLTARGGRQYIEVGRGIALGKILDAGLFEIEARNFSFSGFAGQSIESEDNIDRSTPGFTRSRRTFYGGEFRYTGIDRHEPYTFLVIQRDGSEEKPATPFQDYRYHSQYYGVGSRGSLAPNCRYELESLWEFGRSVANGQQDDDEAIRGYAFNAEVNYYCDHPLRPVLTGEYGYASGDGDRQRATTAFLGNTAGTADQAFQGFGYVNSGLALGARFTNLQFLRMGGRFTPYEKKTAAGRIDVGADYYFLFKADKDGPISDFRAADTSADVGQEIDVFVEWRILSDLSWTFRYGRFYPGQAYLDRKPRDFLFTGFSISF